MLDLPPLYDIMSLPTLDSIDVTGKRVLLRADLNVPLDNRWDILNDARICLLIPTLKALLKRNAKVLIVSHLGRPAEGKVDPNLSLSKVATRLSQLLEQPVPLYHNWLLKKLPDSPVVLAENVRFLSGESKNDPELAHKMASLVDVVVMDAFATAHRTHASTTGIIEFGKQVCMGLLFEEEIKTLTRIMTQPKRPFVAVVGGAKISSKLPLIRHLIPRVDSLIMGGGIANTFLAARGYSIGRSLHEASLIEVAKEIDAQAVITQGHKIELPEKVVVATELSENATTKIKSVRDISPVDMILDFAPQSVERLTECIEQAQTVLWSGPIGVFECTPFRLGTQKLAQAIASTEALTVAGGGDTLSAIEEFKVKEQLSYVSTGGGAFLNFVSGQPLPVIEALKAVKYAY